MKKLSLIIKREFLAKVKNKSFLMMTFLSPLLMMGMITLVFFLIRKNNENIKKIAYVDASGLFSKRDFKDTKTVKYINYTSLGIAETKNKIAIGNYYGLLYIPSKDSLELLAKSVEFYSKDSPSIIMIENLEKKIEHKLQYLKLLRLGIDLQKIKSSKFTSEIKMFNFSGEKSSKLINGLKIGLGTVAGYLIMMFVILYGNSVMRSVIEEKTSRIIEVIISSVKPFQLMLGKIIGNASAGLLQFFIWGILFLVISLFASSFFGVNLLGGQTDNISMHQVEATKHLMDGNQIELVVREIFKLPLLSMFLLFLFYFLGGYLLYSSLFAAIGAAVDSETDTQQFVMPILLPLMLAVYVGFATVIYDPHGPVSVLFSYIPLTSPIVMLMRFPFGVPWWQLAISMVLLLLCFVGVVWMAAKIYRVGILMYGKKPTYKDLWKWLRYKG